MSHTYEYARPSVTVDVVIVTRESAPRVLLIRRNVDAPTEGGKWALPGGFQITDAPRGTPWRRTTETAVTPAKHRMRHRRDRFAGRLIGNLTLGKNERALEVYFPRDTSRMKILEPFELTETKGHYDVIVSVRGGGIAAQAEAVRHGISRALVVASEALRPALRKGGMLTRDPREVERKKYGRHKARKRPQYSKR